VRVLVLSPAGGDHSTLRAALLTEHEVISSSAPVRALITGGRRWRPEAVHARGPAMLAAGALVAARRAIPLVYDAPGTVEPVRGRDRLAERLLVPRCAAVVAGSAGEARQLHDRHRLAVLPVVLDPDGLADSATALLLALYHRLPAGRSRGRRGSRWSVGLRAARTLATELPNAADRRALRRPLGFAWYAYGRHLRAVGRHGQAADAFAAAARRGDDARYDAERAQALKDSGRVEEGRAAYLAVVSGAKARDDETLARAGLALARLGATKDAGVVARRLEDAPVDDGRRQAQIAELHVALGDTPAALRAADRASALDPDDLYVLRTRSRVLRQAGEPSAALALARRRSTDEGERRLEGQLRTLDPAWEPSVTGGRPPVERVPGRILHLLGTSLPYATSGYAYRSAAVLAAQRRLTLEPIAATRLGFPVTRGRTDFALAETVDGTVHHRFVPLRLQRYGAVAQDQLLQANVDLLADLVGRVRPALLQATTPWLNGLLGLALRRAFSIPLVYDVRGFPEMTWAVRDGGDASELYRLRRVAETRCMREADRVITLSETMRAHIAGRGIDAARIHVVPHAVDIDAFAPRPPDPDLLRRHGLTGGLVVGCVSSLLGYEGLDTLLRAIAAVRRCDRRVMGLLVGDGAAMPHLRELVHELDLEDAVVLTGRVPHAEVAGHLSLIDVFVVPRHDHEVCRFVTPLKPFEAMAAGRCMVVSDLPALAEAVGGGSAGRIVTPDDHGELAAVLEELAARPDERARLASAARELAVAQHGPEAIDRAMAGALAALTGPGPAPARRHRQATRA